MAEPGAPAPRALLAARVLVTYLAVLIDLRRRVIGEVVAGAVEGRRSREDPRRLARAVTTVMGRSVRNRARCIHRALVLQRLLAAQGDRAEVVIGLLPQSSDVRAHAWVELAGRDLGPAPGRGQHVAMARYG